ncbi:uncharacterized protein MYCFIDRAFT_180073 [Pseudocercospora fijiensis CIRAD86]|uniref:Uncharacterized protein n=1 Tax=Pseudocercospora fijiensis (strain CIRAD86) TaxID=383855 RepID=M2ZYK3_PSEFD|nr:uncharacterized protein MYCFIDRAFT_180073 [Pseudocercospora fijiensis CIRAD86]EME77196.1 hypothetical protein MYCFIDRAFT_180073 [Pseudocercospora fijiensis CIRAD86]
MYKKEKEVVRAGVKNEVVRACVSGTSQQIPLWLNRKGPDSVNERHTDPANRLTLHQFQTQPCPLFSTLQSAERPAWKPKWYGNLTSGRRPLAGMALRSWHCDNSSAAPAREFQRCVQQMLMRFPCRTSQYSFIKVKERKDNPSKAHSRDVDTECASAHCHLARYERVIRFPRSTACVVALGLYSLCAGSHYGDGDCPDYRQRIEI